MFKRSVFSVVRCAVFGVVMLLWSTTTMGGVIVSESFGGGGGALDGTTADTFAAGISAAGGSSTWVAAGTFLDDGSVTSAGGNSGAYLNLGTYIDDAKGTSTGLFELTMTISEVTPNAAGGGEWISLGFSTLNAPATNTNFTGGTAEGIATIIRREIEDDDLDMFVGPQTAGSIPGPEETGARTLTITLDFRPGTGNGEITYTDSLLGVIGGPTALPNESFGAIYISEAGNSGGTIRNLTLTQIPEPASIALLGLGGLMMLRRRRA